MSTLLAWLITYAGLLPFLPRAQEDVNYVHLAFALMAGGALLKYLCFVCSLFPAITNDYVAIGGAASPLDEDKRRQVRPPRRRTRAPARPPSPQAMSRPWTFASRSALGSMDPSRPIHPSHPLALLVTRSSPLRLAGAGWPVHRRLRLLQRRGGVRGLRPVRGRGG